MSKEKQNFLKRYPFITIILFLLFAWFWLKLFIYLKGSYYTYPPIFNQEIHCEKGYSLKINFEKEITLKNINGEIINFPYKEMKQENGIVVLETKNSKDKLMIKVDYPKIYFKKNKEICNCKFIK